MIRWGCLHRVLTASLGAAAGLIAASMAPAQLATPSPASPPPLESLDEVNPLGRLAGVPQPISLAELRRLFECSELDADTRYRLLDTIAEYRRRVAELREREMLPAVVALRFDPVDEARPRARAKLAAAVDLRAKLDQELFSELQRHAEEVSCAAILAEVRGAIERRFIRERFGSARVLLGYDIEVGPLARAALAEATDSLNEILLRDDRTLLDLLRSLEAEAAQSDERFRRLREERGLLRANDAPPMTPEERHRYFAELDAVALEADAPKRAIAASIGRHHRATIGALRAAMPEPAWRRMRDRWYALTYGGPFHRQRGHPSNGFEWTLRALRSAEPADETAIATLEAHEAEWRRRRDALETKLADAVDAVRTAGGDAPIEPGADDPLLIAIAPILEEIEVLDTETGDQIAAVSGRVGAVFGQGAGRAGWVMRRSSDDESTWPPRPASRRMALADDATRPPLPRSDETNRLQPLDEQWLDSILDRHRTVREVTRAAADAVQTPTTAAAGASIATVNAVGEEQRLAALAAFDAYLSAVAPFQEVGRDRTEVRSDLQPGGERQAMADVHDARELWFEALAREEAVLFETLGRILGPDATGGWTSLRFELAVRDRERLASGMGRGGGSSSMLATSHETSLDLVRLIDEDPSLSSLREGGDAERRGAIVEFLRDYGRRLAEPQRRLHAVADEVAEAARTRPHSSDWFRDLQHAQKDLRRVHRNSLDALESMLADPDERVALRRAYARAAWPVVFGTRAVAPDRASAEFAAALAHLERLDDELLTMLLDEPPMEPGMSVAVPFERLARFDGVRWEREEQLLDLALRRPSP